MRLIDADALLDDFRDRAVKARNWKENAVLNGNEEATIRADATLAFLTEVKLTIENAPTIDERPKGKWISREDMNYLDENKVTHNHFMCDRCGLVHDFIDGHTAQYNFCPNCGADMRSVDEGLHERAVSDLSKTVDDLYKKLRGDV